MPEHSKLIFTAVGAVTIALYVSVGFVYTLVPSTPLKEGTTTRAVVVTTTTWLSGSAGVEVLSARLVNNTVGALVDFDTTIMNTGPVPIYFYGVGASSLTITWNPDSAIKASVPIPPYCSLPGVAIIVQPGQTASPNFLACNNSYHYTLQQTGTVRIYLSFEWGLVNGSEISNAEYLAHYSENYTVV